MLTAMIIVARVQPGTSEGITDLLLPHPSSGLKNNYSGPSSFKPLNLYSRNYIKMKRQQEVAVTFVAFRTFCKVE